ncbi:hypothetical protein TI39_contig410g00007 [Zymoseptoria brevis]|uniref:Uncharacterized protein n=1 Tax=Zymoseptoria brevis TaxID=1047168 RepID=A0A0F4GM77_9PEZI|nr:hypothetical protein TI39_contig410g00007 [Zymoseptoria brevis]
MPPKNQAAQAPKMKQTDLASLGFTKASAILSNSSMRKTSPGQSPPLPAQKRRRVQEEEQRVESSDEVLDPPKRRHRRAAPRGGSEQQPFEISDDVSNANVDELPTYRLPLAYEEPSQQGRPSQHSPGLAAESDEQFSKFEDRFGGQDISAVTLDGTKAMLQRDSSPDNEDYDKLSLQDGDKGWGVYHVRALNDADLSDKHDYMGSGTNREAAGLSARIDQHNDSNYREYERKRSEGGACSFYLLMDDPAVPRYLMFDKLCGARQPSRLASNYELMYLRKTMFLAELSTAGDAASSARPLKPQNIPTPSSYAIRELTLDENRARKKFAAMRLQDRESKEQREGRLQRQREVAARKKIIDNMKAAGSPQGAIDAVRAKQQADVQAAIPRNANGKIIKYQYDTETPRTAAEIAASHQGPRKANRVPTLFPSLSKAFVADAEGRMARLHN